MKNYLFRLFILIFLLFQVLSLAKADNLAPEVVMGARTISTATTELFVEKGYVLIDVRGIDDYSNGHISGAYHLPVKSEEFTSENLQKIVERDQAVIFYCNGINCMGSSMASVKAVEWGWINVLYYRDGFEGWQETGLTITKK
ncbi:MAG: rhodanese-like domain-containing protein [Betaproteobacteria bacterium]|nr:rhodanese-like domain-containing protein [Betaproteobacteria bacterium]